MYKQHRFGRPAATVVTGAVLMLSLGGCLGAVAGATVDVTLEVAKVPFKVAGAVVDVVSGDDEEKD